MLGVLFTALGQYAVERHGAAAWDDARRDPRFPPREAYERAARYPDEELTGRVDALARAIGSTPDEVYEGFGHWLAPLQLDAYRSLLDPAWRTLDLLEHVEDTHHAAVRLQSPNADPPTLRTTRRGADELVVHYGSPRRLCALGRGFIRGIAEELGEHVVVTEIRCMHRGDPVCEIQVARLGG